MKSFIDLSNDQIACTMLFNAIQYLTWMPCCYTAEIEMDFIKYLKCYSKFSTPRLIFNTAVWLDFSQKIQLWNIRGVEFMGRLLFTRHGRSQEIKDPLSLKLKGLEVGISNILRWASPLKSLALYPLKTKKKQSLCICFISSTASRSQPVVSQMIIKSQPLCRFSEHFGVNAPSKAVGRYLPPRPHQASHKQSSVLPTVPRVFPSPFQRHASLCSVHWHGGGVQLSGLSFKSTCFSPLISHPSRRLTASPRPPLIYPSARTRWTSVHLLHRFCPPFDTHTHTPYFFFSYHSPSFSFSHNPLFLSIISLGSPEHSWWHSNSPVCMGSVFHWYRYIIWSHFPQWRLILLECCSVFLR